MFDLYFKNDKVSFRKQRVSLKFILINYLYWSKAQIVNNSVQRPKIGEKKNRCISFSGTLKVLENKVFLLFFIFGLWVKIMTISDFDQSICLVKILFQTNLRSLNLGLPFLK